MPGEDRKNFDQRTTQGDPGESPSTEVPLLKEIEIIKSYSVVDHIILLDDIQRFGTWEFHYLSKAEFAKNVKILFPNHCISYYENVMSLTSTWLSPIKEIMRSKILRKAKSKGSTES